MIRLGQNGGGEGKKMSLWVMQHDWSFLFPGSKLDHSTKKVFLGARREEGGTGLQLRDRLLLDCPVKGGAEEGKLGGL